MAERDYLLIGDNEFRQHVRRLGSMGYGRMLRGDGLAPGQRPALKAVS